jgi:hypothetical protein
MPPKSKTDKPTDSEATSLEEPTTVETSQEYLALQAELETFRETSQKFTDDLRKQVDDLRGSLAHSDLVKADLEAVVAAFTKDLASVTRELNDLQKKVNLGMFDNVIHVDGIPHKIVHKNVAKEFLEDLKKRHVSEEVMCLAVAKV